LPAHYFYGIAAGCCRIGVHYNNEIARSPAGMVTVPTLLRMVYRHVGAANVAGIFAAAKVAPVIVGAVALNRTWNTVRSLLSCVPVKVNWILLTTAVKQLHHLYYINNIVAGAL